MIADRLRDKNLKPVVNELFIRDRKLHVSLIFITHFVVLKYIRLNSAQYFIIKITNK